MTAGEAIGWLAAALTLLTFLQRAMLPLRLTAIAANCCFIAYGTLSGLMPVVTLHMLLLPCNLLRLHQLLGHGAHAIMFWPPTAHFSSVAALMTGFGNGRGDAGSSGEADKASLLPEAFDRMPLGAVVFDGNLRARTPNTAFCRLSGMSKGEAVGLTLDRIMSRLAREAEPALPLEAGVFGRLSGMGEPWQIVMVREGRKLEVVSNPLPEGGAAVTFADVTRRNPLVDERQLAFSQGEIGAGFRDGSRLATGMPEVPETAQQKLLQPLTAARLHAVWLLEHADDSTVASAATRIEDALDVLERLLDNCFHGKGG